VGAGVLVGIGVLVGVGVGVLVGVIVGVGARVPVGVIVGGMIDVGVGVFIGVGPATQQILGPNIMSQTVGSNGVSPASHPALISSNLHIPGQGGRIGVGALAKHVERFDQLLGGVQKLPVLFSTLTSKVYAMPWDRPLIRLNAPLVKGAIAQTGEPEAAAFGHASRR
jgi:hypothetical protein